VSASDPPPLITECPNCHTRFRVGESQLQMAHGRVRCGACLAVFAGVDHLLLDDSTAPPELPADPDEIDSVLAELEVSSAPEEVSTEQDLQPPTDQSTGELDWTNVSVDTREFGRSTTQEELPLADTAGDETLHAAGQQSELAPVGEPRASISDAISDEEALRWWLEDELPGAVDSDVFDESEDGKEMVVQLSQLDAVQDEQLDLQSLVGAGEDQSTARALEEMFEEDLVEDLVQELGEDTDRKEVPDLDDQEEPTTVEELASNFAKPDELTEPPGDVSADELQHAIDKAEPLVSRAMANGTITAAAERMSGAALAKSSAAPSKSGAEKVAAGPVALVESPHQSSTPVADTPAAAPVEPAKPPKPAKPAVAAEPASPVDVWESTEFSETPAELVEGIAEEMAAAGQPVVEPTPSLFERGRTLINQFLGHALALRIATALAFALLTAQILYWQFADWSKTETMRPVYAGLCNVLGCELPARRSVRDLQSRKLAVRSHPEKDGSLLVDALIINEAGFEQPFPVIELQFMDMAQQVVESYRLEPSSYLDGELLGSDVLMAVRTPVHIDIDIPDPGPRAVNYQLQFR